MRIQPGTRVFAVRDADETNVYLYGYGTYAGDLPCPILPFGITETELRRIAVDAGEDPDDFVASFANRPNPAIDLDDGKGRIWGMQCC